MNYAVWTYDARGVLRMHQFLKVIDEWLGLRVQILAMLLVQISIISTVGSNSST